MSHALLPDVRTYTLIAPQANTLGESDEGEALYARHCPCQVLEVTGGCLEHSPYPTQSNHSTSYLSTPPPIYSPSRLCSRLLSSTQPHAYDYTPPHSTLLGLRGAPHRDALPMRRGGRARAAPCG